MPGKSKENWVEYSELKERISMEMVLARYGLLDKLRPSGANLTGCCPIHKGSNSRQFSVNLERNLFNCFGNCKSGGNILDFVAKMEKVSTREAALLLKDWFPSTCPPADTHKLQSKEIHHGKKRELVRKEKEAATAPDEEDPREAVPESSLEPLPEPAGPVNPPLTFTLRKLDPAHPFFEERGILPETVAHFGLGFCSRGILKDRIAIPIHNQAGELVAYCGRAVSPEQIEAEGKYKLPGGFVKSALVYNFNRQAPATKSLILVESYLSVWILHQAGRQNAVALMGSALSDCQEELLVEFLGTDGQAILFFDADEDGAHCTEECLLRLGRKVFVKALDVSPYGRKPHQLNPEQIQTLFSFVSS